MSHLCSHRQVSDKNEQKEVPEGIRVRPEYLIIVLSSLRSGFYVLKGWEKHGGAQQVVKKKPCLDR